MSRYAAGITLYNPEIDRLQKNIAAIIPQVEKVYIVDNASQNISAFISQYENDERVKIIKNDENLGIARALNQMCSAALEDGFDWILTLDQDSICEDDIIEKYSCYTDREDVAIITPRFSDDNEPQSISSSGFAPFEFVERCNTSASLIRLSVYKEVGGFDDIMFIDFVDFDFCASVIENGYFILRDNASVLHHQLGSAKEITFFIPIGRLLGIKKLQKPLFTYNHSPLRTYYYVRNIRYFSYKHRQYFSPRYNMKVCFRWLSLKFLFEKERCKKISASIKGFIDGGKLIKSLKQNNI